MPSIKVSFKKKRSMKMVTIIRMMYGRSVTKFKKNGSRSWDEDHTGARVVENVHSDTSKLITITAYDQSELSEVYMITRNGKVLSFVNPGGEV